MSYFYWLFLKGNNFQRIESAAEIIKIIKVILQYWISAQDFYSTKVPGSNPASPTMILMLWWCRKSPKKRGKPTCEAKKGFKKYWITCTVMQLTVEIVAGSEDCFYLPDLNISQTLEIEFQVTCVSTCFSTVSLLGNLLHAVSLFNTM